MSVSQRFARALAERSRPALSQTNPHSLHQDHGFRRVERRRGDGVRGGSIRVATWRKCLSLLNHHGHDHAEGKGLGMNPMKVTRARCRTMFGMR